MKKLVTVMLGIGVLAALFLVAAHGGADTAESARPADGGGGCAGSERVRLRLEVGAGRGLLLVCEDSRDPGADGRGLHLTLPGGLSISIEPGDPPGVVIRIGDHAVEEPKGDQRQQPPPPPAVPDGGAKGAGGPPTGKVEIDASGGRQVTNIAVDMRDGVRATDGGCQVRENVQTGEISIGRLTVHCEGEE